MTLTDLTNKLRRKSKYQLAAEYLLPFKKGEGYDVGAALQSDLTRDFLTEIFGEENLTSAETGPITIDELKTFEAYYKEDTDQYDIGAAFEGGVRLGLGEHQ